MKTVVIVAISVGASIIAVLSILFGVEAYQQNLYEQEINKIQLKQDQKDEEFDMLLGAGVKYFMARYYLCGTIGADVESENCKRFETLKLIIFEFQIQESFPDYIPYNFESIIWDELHPEMKITFQDGKNLMLNFNSEQYSISVDFIQSEMLKQESILSSYFPDVVNPPDDLRTELMFEAANRRMN